MKTILTQQEAAKILEPYLSTIRKIMLESLEELNKAMAVITESLNNRAKCATLHSIAIEKAKRYFKGMRGIIIKSKYQSIQIVFDQQLVGRIKKVNDDKLSRNANTERNRNILNHQLSLFPDIPSLTFIDLAYKIIETWSDYDRLLVVCRFNDKVEWDIDYKETAITKTIETKEIEIPKIKEEQIKIKKGGKAI
jgi:hypothetical protein